MSWLSRREFGDPILRQKARRISKHDLMSVDVQKLIQDMKRTLTSLELGVGLAAPQVGKSLQLFVVAIQPLPHRPVITPFEQVFVNPKILQTYGKPVQLWESCISSGPGQAGLFAKVPRYPKVKVSYQDERGNAFVETYSGLPAHVIQHEVDHLHGVLFVDKVTNPKTFMTYHEYIKQIVEPNRV